jgi:hypothetical protein
MILSAPPSARTADFCTFGRKTLPFFLAAKPPLTSSREQSNANHSWRLSAPSGSGKSSVVRAGLVPRLRSDRRTAWETVILVPTDQPLKALARALVPLLEPTMGEVDRLAEAAKLQGQNGEAVGGVVRQAAEDLGGSR